MTTQPDPWKALEEVLAAHPGKFDPAKLYGTDYDAKMVAWCGRAHRFLLSARQALASKPPASPPPVAVDEGAEIAQEPKYRFERGAIYNRASGEMIPHDEPVMVFRARDRRTERMIEFYRSLCSDYNHRVAVARRGDDFAAFAKAHPERMKEPDTAPHNVLAAHLPPVEREPLPDAGSDLWWGVRRIYGTDTYSLTIEDRQALASAPKPAQPEGWPPSREVIFRVLSDYGEEVRRCWHLDQDPVADPFIARLLAASPKPAQADGWQARDILIAEFAAQKTNSDNRGTVAGYARSNAFRDAIIIVVAVFDNRFPALPVKGSEGEG